MARYRINSSKPTAIVVHGLHKSGTMFLYQLFRRLSRARRIAFYSGNHEEPNDHLITRETDQDFCLCPIRDFNNSPECLSPTYCVERIFHVRDPRDILVSQYYSFGWRHTEEGFTDGTQRQREFIQNLSIDDYVLNQQSVLRPLKQRFADLTTRDPAELTNLVRYEQMVLDWPNYLASVMKPFGFHLKSLTKLRFAFRYRNEFKPDTNPTGHKRSVTPGDYLRQLKPETIHQLNEILEPELRVLGYDIKPANHSISKVA